MKCKKCDTAMSYNWHDHIWVCPKCGNGFYMNPYSVERMVERESKEQLRLLHSLE